MCQGWAHVPQIRSNHDDRPSAGDDRYARIDFEKECSTDAILDKFVLTITEEDEDIAVIVHLTNDGGLPLDGKLAERKRQMAARIVSLRNADESSSVADLPDRPRADELR
jgi:hypothetical protein